MTCFDLRQFPPPFCRLPRCRTASGEVSIFAPTGGSGKGRDLPFLYRQDDRSPGRPRQDQLLAVSGSITCGTSVIAPTGMPDSSECFRIAASLSAR